MNLPITGLDIAGYRSLTELTIGPLGRVNLITGKNNSGKSSLLEAIRLLATQGSPNTLQSILKSREEHSGLLPETDGDAADAFSVSSLFSGYPSFAASDSCFSIAAHNGNTHTLKIVASIRRYSEQVDESGERRLIPAQGEPYDLGDTIPVFEVLGPSGSVRRMRLNRRDLARTNVDRLDGSGVRCVYLDAACGGTDQLAELWDSIALTEMEKSVVDALRLISPEIEAVSMVGGAARGLPRVAIARSARLSKRVPLRAFGDGVNRLFGIVLSLVSARDGLLLIDEFENGLHHSILVDVWRVVFATAARANVQVFATTHSWDCIRGFQEAAAESPEVGVLVRLSARDDSVIPTVFSEDELQIVSRDRIEVR